jgi:hypothetical protein
MRKSQEEKEKDYLKDERTCVVKGTGTVVQQGG